MENEKNVKNIIVLYVVLVNVRDLWEVRPDVSDKLTNKETDI